MVRARNVLLTASLVLLTTGAWAAAQLPELGATAHAPPIETPSPQTPSPRSSDSTPDSTQAGSSESDEQAYQRLWEMAVSGQQQKSLDGLNALLERELSPKLRTRIYSTAIAITGNIEDWTEAFKWLRRGMADLPDDKASTARLLATAAYLHTLAGSTDRARELGRQALAMAEESGDRAVLCRALSPLALGEAMAERYAEAEAYRRRQVEVCESVGDEVYAANGLFGIGSAAQARGRNEEALAWGERALALARKADFVDGIHAAELLIAHCLIGLGRQPERAEGLLASSLRYYSTDHPSASSLSEVGVLWSQLTDRRGDTAGALIHLQEAMAQTKEAERNARARQLAFLQVQFDTQVKEQEISLLKAEKDLAEVRADSNRKTQWLLLLGVGGLAIAAALLIILLRRSFRDRQKFRWRAEHDSLTQLYNHQQMLKVGESTMARALQHKCPFTAVAIDIDLFKEVNDSYGHEAGDEVLRQLGIWIAMAIDDNAIAARRGGDEFMILMEGDVIQAEAMLQKLRALIGPVQSLGQSIAFTISAGVCQTEDGAGTLTQLMHNADQALYRAKRQGRNRSVMLHEDEPHVPRPTTRLVIVGCGIQFARHVSERTLSEIRQAEVVFCLADSFALGMVREMRPDVIDLSGHYASGKDRRQTYRDMEAALMQPLLDGKQVCAVFYGHPGVFADVPHKVMRQARAMGIDARMEPGISAEACLYADLGIDPGQRGVQSMEATHFMVYDRQLDPASLVLLWQVTLTGDLSCTRTEADPAALRALVDRLLIWYPPEHEVILYEAANVPIQNPRGDRLRLCDLPHAHYREYTTLVIPPLVELQAVDLQFVRLGKRD